MDEHFQGSCPALFYFLGQAIHKHRLGGVSLYLAALRKFLAKPLEQIGFPPARGIFDNGGQAFARIALCMPHV